MSASLFKLLACTAVVVGSPVLAQGSESDSRWRIELALGDAYDFRTRMRVAQSGGYSTRVTAHYATQPFDSPPYYAWRIARWSDGRAWELQVIHHKLFLGNPPKGVQRLSITHGFNLITLNRAYERGAWAMRFGLGPVVTHLEARVNGVPYDGPYHPCGVVALAGLSRSYRWSRSVFVKAELLGSVGYAKPKSDGPRDLEVSVLHTAIHAQFGMGFEL